MNNHTFWKAMMAGSVLGWLFILWGIFFPFNNHAIWMFWVITLLAWVILHPLELAISLPIGKEKGLTPERIFIKTMLFGFTWWLPLKLGVLDE